MNENEIAVLHEPIADHTAPMQTSESSSSPGARDALSFSGTVGWRRLAANRRNARKSTGPRTEAGKYRSALNASSRRLLPKALERELLARGEDPRDFCRLHRDLTAIFRPRHPEIATAVMMLARAWWQKARRMRQWVGSGPPRSPELDARIEALLLVLAGQMGRHHRHWQTALEAVVGAPIGSPSDVRRRMEQRLTLFGAKPLKRRRLTTPAYDPERDGERLQACLETLVQEILAEEGHVGAAKVRNGQSSTDAGAGASRA